MNNKKKLIEKRNSLLEEMKEITNKSLLETRAFTKDEEDKFNELKELVEQINSTISAIDDMKSLDDEDKTKVSDKEKTENEGESNMEKRALVEKEVRAMSTGSIGEAVPVQLSNQVIQKLDEIAGLVNETEKVQIVGDYQILVEKNGNGKAQILGENERLDAVDLEDFEVVKLSDKRIATEVVVSEKLINNSPVIAHEYIANEVAKRVYRTLEEQIINGDGSGNNFNKGIVNVVEPVEVSKFDTDVLMEMVVGFNPELVKNAKFILNRKDLVELSKLKDNNGKYYLTLENIVNEGPHYMIMGIPVVISDYMPVGTIALANVKDGYKLKVNGDMSVKVLQEKYSDIGSLGFIINAYFDGSMVDKQAVKLVKKPSTGKAQR